VEDTAELDRALESGHVTFEHARAERYQSDPGNDISSDPEGGAGDSESSSSFSFQPKSRAGSHSPQPRLLQESSRTRCTVLTSVKNDLAARRITTSWGIARLHKPLSGEHPAAALSKVQSRATPAAGGCIAFEQCSNTATAATTRWYSCGHAFLI
jgi:hypothetical protein